jgi:hypothetical protein
MCGACGVCGDREWRDEEGQQPRVICRICKHRAGKGQRVSAGFAMLSAIPGAAVQGVWGARDEMMYKVSE